MSKTDNFLVNFNMFKTLKPHLVHHNNNIMEYFDVTKYNIVEQYCGR